MDTTLMSAKTVFLVQRHQQVFHMQEHLEFGPVNLHSITIGHGTLNKSSNYLAFISSSIKVGVSVGNTELFSRPEIL